MFRLICKFYPRYRVSPLSSIRYLHHPRIANEIEEHQDFHPLVMFTDQDEHSNQINPFTGNDRFVVYEDGGRPMDIHLKNGWRPSCASVTRIASQLVEVLGYLFSKRVVHRKLELGSVALNPESCDIKLLWLGEAKYIERLDYEHKISEFKQDYSNYDAAISELKQVWQGVPAVASSTSHHSKRKSSPSPPPNPAPEDITEFDNPATNCKHPDLT
jgi:hypothetical protein